MKQRSDEWPPDWHWKLSVERRLIELQYLVCQLGRGTTAHKDENPTWMPRDYMAAGAGVVMVMGALSEKVGWTTLGAFLARIYGGK